MDPTSRYTLSQVLEKYYQQEGHESDIPSLHNLQYLNIIWNLGDHRHD
jgi:hypothetical protein